MASFDYSGFDKSGARTDGQIDAQSLLEARQILLKNGFLIKKLSEVNTQRQGLAFSSASVSLGDIEFLTAELSVLLDAGLKIDKGLELLRVANKKPALNRLLNKIASELRSGKQLSQALAQTSGVFDPLYINLVSIGEATGRLPEIFRSLAEDLAYRKDLQQKVLQAITYPAVILAVCLLSIFFIFNYVVPNMASLFADNTNLPWYTAALLSASAWVQAYQWFMVGALVLGIVFILFSSKQALVKSASQKLALRLPLFKSAVILIERIRFNTSLAMMLKAGLAIDSALELARGSVKNVEIQRELLIAINKVKRGELLSGALRQTRLYPDFFASLLAVGEESGELAKIFNEIAIRSQKEFTAWVNRVTSLLEPLMILTMGGIVGSVVIIMMLSITSVTDLNF